MILFKPGVIYVVYKEIIKMTYEEAVAEVLKAAGDYKSISNTYDIEATINKRTVTQLREKVDSAIEELSLSSDAIKISVDLGKIVIEAFNHKSKSLWFSVHDAKVLTSAEVPFIDYLDKAFRDFLNQYVYYSSMKMKDVQRFCGYANLILSSITPEVINNFNELGEGIGKAEKALTEGAKIYKSYCDDLKEAMNKAAELWLDALSIEPNMKLSIKDFRFTDGKTSVRTVKRVKPLNRAFLISFNETSSTIKNKDHIDAFESWLINNPQFLEISKVLKEPDLDKLY